MIQLTPQMRILVAIEPADFRKGIDGLARVCREELKSDPFQGTVFVFRNRRGTALKLLTYDGQGFWLLQKRLSSGNFKDWPKEPKEKIKYFDVPQLQLLLWNGDPKSAKTAPLWRKVKCLPDDHINNNTY
jgi:transposase